MPKTSPPAARDPHDEKSAQIQAMAAAMQHNAIKTKEHGLKNALTPPRGPTINPASPIATGSTWSEISSNDKVGNAAAEGVNATITLPFGGIERQALQAQRQARGHPFSAKEPLHNHLKIACL